MLSRDFPGVEGKLDTGDGMGDERYRGTILSGLQSVTVSVINPSWIRMFLPGVAGSSASWRFSRHSYSTRRVALLRGVTVG